MEAGRFITSGDASSGSDVIVLGAITAQELFGNSFPIGRSVDVAGQLMTVIGVLAPVGNGTSATSNQDDLAIVPISTAQEAVLGVSPTQSVQSILIKATCAKTLSAAYQEADKELLMLHGITTPPLASWLVKIKHSPNAHSSRIRRSLLLGRLRRSLLRINRW